MNAPGLDWKSVYAAMHRDGEAAFPPAALHYVLQIVRASAKTDTRPEALIATFRRALRNDFGPLLGDVVTEWNIRNPADFGRAILLLGKYRCLSLEPSDTAEAFAADGRAFHEEPAG